MWKKVSIAVLLLTTGLLILVSRLSKKAELNHCLTLYGNVDVRQVDLGFRVSGRVVAMPYEEGDLVQQDTLMANIEQQPYLDLLHQAEAKVLSINYSLLNAEENLKRRAQLLESGAVSKEDYENTLYLRNSLSENLKEAKAAAAVALKNLNDTKLIAPSTGTILTRIREPGAVVREADPIYTLSLISPIWVRAFVSELELGLIYPGMAATIFTDTPGGTVYQGHIGFISPVAEFTPKTVESTHLRTDLVYRLRIIADNPDEGLRQGMPVTVKLALKSDTP
jgi:HlyD family secretion protein